VLGLFAFNDLASDTTDTEILTDSESGLIRQVKSRTLKVDDNGFIANKDDTPPRLFSADWLIRNTAIGRTYNVAKHKMKASPGAIEKPGELKSLDLGQFDETALTALGHIREIDQLARENNSTLVVFYIPFASDISEYPICRYSAPSCEEIRESNVLGVALESWAKENDVHFIDPVDDFRSREQAGEKLYYQYDGHWTSKGHAAAGSLVEQYLRDNQLINSD
jgi:hypothetical protein